MSKQSMSSTGIPLNPFAFIRKYDELWTRLLFLIGALIVYRLGSHIPVPGINQVNLADLFKIVTGAGNGTSVSGDGTTASPLKVDQNAVAAAAVATGDDGTLPTDVYTSTGAVANFLLGDPEGFATFYVGGVAKKVPYYA